MDITTYPAAIVKVMKTNEAATRRILGAVHRGREKEPNTVLTVTKSAILSTAPEYSFG
jgi:hypothetical protein